MAKDAEDAHAAYYLGQCHAREGDFEAAASWYRRARDGDPYLRSAYYGLFQAEQRLGNAEAAKAVLSEFQNLDGNPRSRQAEFKYTRMGPKAEVSTAQIGAAPPPNPPEGPLFLEPAPLAELPLNAAWIPPRSMNSVTPCDIDGDGSLDLFLPGAYRIGDAPREWRVPRGPGSVSLGGRSSACRD